MSNMPAGRLLLVLAAIQLLPVTIASEPDELRLFALVGSLELNQFFTLQADFRFDPEQFADDDRRAAAESYVEQWLTRAEVNENLEPMFDEGGFIYATYASLDAELKILAPYVEPEVTGAIRRRYSDLVAGRLNRWKLDQLTDDKFEALHDLAANFGDELPWGGHANWLEARHRRLIDAELRGKASRVIQQEIARYRHLRAEEITWRVRNLFERLREHYLRGLGPLFSEYYYPRPVDWDRPSAYALRGSITDDWMLAQREAFRLQIDRDCEDWHPLFRLMVMEEIFGAGSGTAPARQLFDRVMSWSDPKTRARVELLADSRYGSRVASGFMSRADALRTARRYIDNAIATEANNLLWMFVMAFEDRLVGTLTQNLNLAIDMMRRGTIIVLDPATKVTTLTERILVDPPIGFGAAAKRLRTDPESGALSAAIHRSIDLILTDGAIVWYRRDEKLHQLTTILAWLQTAAAKDRLLLLFEHFDKYRGVPDITSRFAHSENLLIRAHLAFIDIELRAGNADLTMMIVDQWVAWISERLRVHEHRRGELELEFERLVRAFAELRVKHPLIMVRYLDHYYAGGQSVSNPVYYEMVIFDLVDILLTYAEAGRFLEPETGTDTGRSPGSVEPQGLQEEVMDLLRWLNGALAIMHKRLPEIQPEDLDRKQRDVLEKIYGFFELRYWNAEYRLVMDNARFIETVLRLVRRVAHVARPDDLQEKILEPFDQLVRRDLWLKQRYLNPALFVTDDMRESVAFLASVVSAKRGRLERPSNYPESSYRRP